MLEVLSQDYVRTAKAKGVGQRAVLFVHALKNAAVPIITIIGIGVALLIGGAVVTESVFGLPGLGRLTVEAVLSRDFPTIQAVILLFSVVYVVIALPVLLSRRLPQLYDRPPTTSAWRLDRRASDHSRCHLLVACLRHRGYAGDGAAGKDAGDPDLLVESDAERLHGPRIHRAVLVVLDEVVLLAPLRTLHPDIPLGHRRLPPPVARGERTAPPGYVSGAGATGRRP